MRISFTWMQFTSRSALWKGPGGQTGTQITWTLIQKAPVLTRDAVACCLKETGKLVEQGAESSLLLHGFFLSAFFGLA